MALKLETQTQFGIDLPMAYAKIDCFNGNKEIVNINVLFFANEDARTSQKRAIKSTNYSFVFDEYSNKNLIAQGYEYLKTLPEFLNAIDC